MSITVPEQRPLLRCLGSASVVAATPADAQPAVLLPLGKPLALLTYLVLAPDRTASRERLADLLWGDQDRTAGRQSVRRALSFVRTHVGSWVISADEHSCTASEHLDADIKIFSSCIDQGEFEQALAYYRGDFLAGFASPGAREFEVWADVERAYCRSKAVRAAESVCRMALDAGRFLAAKCVAMRLRAIEPNGQLGWRLLLEALAAGGDRVGAITEAAKFEAWLEAEELEPEPASMSAIRMARQTATPARGETVVRSAVASDLVGREREFAAVLEAWRRACAGTMQTIVLIGGPGLGKSRLLESVAQRLRSTRKRAVLIRAYPGERSIAGAFAGTLAFEIAALPGASGVPASVVRHLVALDPRLGEHFPVSDPPAPTGSSIAARATALRELISATCEDAPVALLLDDAHWLDDESRELLGAVVARLADVPLMIAVATRDSAALPPLPETRTTVELAPLSASEVGALIASVGALPDEEWSRFLVARVTAAARGIPLLVLGAVEELVAQGALELVEGNWRTPDESRLRERLRSINAVATRLRALSAAGFRLLLACSIAGRPLCPDDVAAIAEALAESASIVELERAGHLKRSASGVEVSHDVIAETAMQIASAEDRERAQRLLGAVLVRSSDDALVEHGIRHLAAVGALDLVRDPLERVMRDSLARGHVAPRDQVARLTGLSSGDPAVKRLANGLPVGLRWRRWRPALAGGMGAIVLGTSAFVATERWRERADQPMLELVTQLGNQKRAHGSVLLDKGAWTLGSPLTVTFGEPSTDTTRRAERGTLWRPGDRAWAIDVESDTGGSDIAEVLPHARRWLAQSHADEMAGAWSPDGRYLAITTSAYAAPPGYGVGIMSVSSRAMRPLRERATNPDQLAWSPDGTRLAFTSTTSPGLGDDVCVIGIDGLGEICHGGFSRAATIDGWLNESSLLLQVGTPGKLFAFDPIAGATTALGVDGVVASDISPDGEWIYFARARGSQLEVYVAPAARPLDARLVTTKRGSDLASNSTAMFWSGRFEQREFLDSVAILSASDTIDLGTEFRLSARGISNEGHEVPVYAARWASSDSNVASIDSVGRLLAKREGVVDVILSAGGWRVVRRRFVVRHEAATVLLREEWRNPFAERWQPFGVPLPTVVQDSILGPSFFNNGDGWYFSGAYLNRPLDARRGLAIDVSVRTPITRPMERYLSLGMLPIRGIAELRSTWDHRTGYFPYRFAVGGECDFAYPAGEGPKSELSTGGGIPRLSWYEHGRPVLATGRPVHLRLQIFPDGSCGIALQGEPPLILEKGLTGLDSVTILIQGNSVGTKMLVGPMTITRGVPAGVDWSHTSRRPIPRDSPGWGALKPTNSRPAQRFR